MISVSDKWKAAHYQTLLPETFIEISCNFGDPVAQDTAVVTGIDEAYFSFPVDLMKPNVRTTTGNKPLTLETNFWILSTLNAEFYGESEDYTPYIPVYASEQDEGGVTITFPEVVTTVSPGITITWRNGSLEEYATKFTVVAKNGNTEVASTTVVANKSVVTPVELELTNYDSITITVTGWSLPDRRVRIHNIELGHTVIFGKEDILSFSHEQSGCINSGELPHSEIRFSIDNSDKRWNPYDPTGDTKFLAERQKVSLRYGMDVDGAVEWIDVGLFYLSEWKIPANGFEAQFVAVDMLTRCSDINTKIYGDEDETAEYFMYFFSDYVKENSTGIPSEWLIGYGGDPDLTLYVPYQSQGRGIGELLQMIANLTGCVIQHPAIYAAFDKPITRIDPLDVSTSEVDYCILLNNAYSYPELELMKPLKSVSVAVTDGERYVLNVNDTGETLMVDNPLVYSEEDAARIAEWVAGNMKGRKILHGEFRADPRMELFDVVRVETSSSTAEYVVITNIKYTYNGSFHGTYEGYVL